MTTQERLKQVMLVNQMNMKEFSDKCGISYRTLQNYLLGKRAIGADALTKICIHLGININWLLTGSGSMHLTSPAPEELPPPSIDNIMKNLTKHQQRTLLGIAQEMLLVRKMAEKLGEKLDEEI